MQFTKPVQSALTITFIIGGFAIAGVLDAGFSKIHLRLFKFQAPGKFQVTLNDGKTLYSIWYFWHWTSKGVAESPNLHPKLVLKKNGVPQKLESYAGFNNSFKNNPIWGYKDDQREGALICGSTLDNGTYTIESETPGVFILEHTQRSRRHFDGFGYPTGFSDDSNFVKPL